MENSLQGKINNLKPEHIARAIKNIYYYITKFRKFKKKGIPALDKFTIAKQFKVCALTVKRVVKFLVDNDYLKKRRHEKLNYYK